MKLHRFVCGIFALGLVLSLSVNSAIAGTPGTCTVVPATPCGSGGTCVVNVSETGTNPALLLTKKLSSLSRALG